MDVDAHRHGGLLVIRERAQSDARPAQSEEEAHGGNAHQGRHRGEKLVGRHRHAVQHERLLGHGEPHPAWDTAEGKDGRAAQQRTDSERHHDERDHRLPNEAAQDHSVEDET